MVAMIVLSRFPLELSLVFWDDIQRVGINAEGAGFGRFD